METSLFIVRLAGPLMIVAALPGITNPTLYEEVGRDFIASRALLFVAGVLTLAMGLAIVNTHNVWVADWRVVITIIGWIGIAAGVVRIAFPSITRSMGERVMASRPAVITLTTVLFVLGAWLSWAGYF